MALTQVFEGTAEEIAEQLRNSRMTSKLKAVVTPDEYHTTVLNGVGETLDKALGALLEEVERIERDIPVPPTDPHEQAFGAIMDEKYRKMGFKL